MNDDKFQKYIAAQFARAPRKPIPEGDKETAWMAVADHIRSARKEAARESAGFTLWPRFRFARTAAAALSVIVISGLTVGLTSAAETSIPGDKLYLVKTSVEKVQVALAVGPEKKVQVLSSHAKTRLEEINTLVNEKNAPEKIVAETLDALKETTKKVHKVVEQTSQSNPNLVDKAITLAAQEEEALTDIQEESTNDSIKEIVQKTITDSRESIDKLKTAGQQGQVEGAAASGEEPNSTSTAPSAPETQAGDPADAEEDGVVESQIQIDGVFRGSQEDQDSKDSPEIIPEPNIQF